MRIWFKGIVTVCFAAISIAAVAQPNNRRDTSRRVFTLQDLEANIIRNHPIVKQAALLSAEAKAKVLQAWGSFDPAVEAKFSSKSFGNTDYYNHWDSELKVPVWLGGADIKVGYDRNVGTYTNPETRTSLSGLTGVGLSIPLGQGFIIDARRSTLRQSRIMVRYAEADQISQINEVWYNAVKDYWNWYYATRQGALVAEGVELAQRRFEFIRAQALLGDKPAIDSVEASITVQERRIQAAKNQVDVLNARLVLSNYLWNSKGDPLELPESAMPPRTDTVVNIASNRMVDTLLNRAARQHPTLVKLQSKSDQLNVEELYRRELLKPKINVSGTLLSSRRSFGSYVPDYYDFGWGNYKVGVDFSFPLLLRSARGKLREVRIQQQEIQYDLQQTGRNIETNIRSSYNSFKAYGTQLNVQTSSITNQRILLRGELQKFALGESTLFVVNSRETKLIDMQIKQAELIANYEKSRAEIYYKAGMRQPPNVTSSSAGAASVQQLD